MQNKYHLLANVMLYFANRILSFVPRSVCSESCFFFNPHDWKITLFTVNKNNATIQSRSTSETDMAEFLESLVSVARRVLREEDQDNVHESNANENLKETLEQLYPIISYSNRDGT